MPSVAISNNLMLTLSDDQWNTVKATLFAGRKIEVIKIVREILPQASLADAKSYVEKIEKDLREKFPEQFTANRDSSPMMRGTLVFLIILAITGYVIFKLLHK
jgi:hypothetical protein